MKKFLRPLQVSTLAILFLFTTSLPAFAATTKPVKYTSPDGNFSITFPGTPEKTSEELETANGSVTLQGVIYAPSEEVAFVIAYSDIVSKEVSKKEAYKLLMDEKKGELTSPGTTQDGKEKKNSYKNYAGLYFKTRKDNLYGITQTYLIKKRLYQILMAKGGSYPTPKEIKDFIGSFRLLKANPVTPADVPSI